MSENYKSTKHLNKVKFLFLSEGVIIPFKVSLVWPGTQLRKKVYLLSLSLVQSSGFSVSISTLRLNC